jgi:hypothetical protein
MPCSSPNKQIPAWLPGLMDFLPAAIMLWLFVFHPAGWSLLLADGDTGWHIRTGEWILENRKVPTQDMFSCTKPGEPWFAWEWLADVVFALIHQAGGLPLLTFFCGLCIVFSAVGVLFLMKQLGAGPFAALPLFFLLVGASTVHYLARPHVFTLGFFLIATLLILRDLEKPSLAVWWLVPLTLLWTNLHGGWPALFTLLVPVIVVKFVSGQTKWKRDLLLLASCAAVTLINPYGWHLHAHVLNYLQDNWIRSTVDEFQSPNFRTESTLQYQVVLLGAILGAGARLRLGWRQWVPALWVLIWAHFSLGAIRHIPLLVIVGAPVAAAALAEGIAACQSWHIPGSLAGILREVETDVGKRFWRLTFWAPLFCFLIWFSNASSWPADFPANRFPVFARKALAGTVGSQNIFTTDQWGGYWLYHEWPKSKVYVDGRSDFYGRILGEKALAIASARPGWQDFLRDSQVSIVLLPPSSPLHAALEALGGEVLYTDGFARAVKVPALRQQE